MEHTHKHDHTLPGHKEMQPMRIAYFDCYTGASGDMILGALLDAGLPLSALLIVTLRTAHDLSLSLETRAFCPLARRTFYREVNPLMLDALAVGVALLWLGVAMRL